MPEIMACPHCKGAPNTKFWSDQDGDVSIYCCGVTVDGGPDQWNEYAVAMDAFLADAWQKEVSEFTQLHFRDEFPLKDEAWSELWASNKTSRVALAEVKRTVPDTSPAGGK